jgi:hypothetical protein
LRYPAARRAPSGLAMEFFVEVGPMSADPKETAFREALVDVMAAAARLTDVREGEHLLWTAWAIVAQQVRSANLFAPGGYQAEQRRQLGELEKLAELVRDDAPDLEEERLLREGNFDALLNYLKRKRDEAGSE